MTDLRATIEAARPPLSEPSPVSPWPKLGKLPPLTPAVPSLPPMLIPASLRPWLADVAERSQIPLEFVAAPALVALASVIGRTVGIRPKRCDDWLVVPNLWGAIIGRPGLMKSPAIAEATRPLTRLATKASEAFKSQEAETSATAQVVKLQIAVLQDQAKQHIKNGDTSALASAQADLIEANKALAEATPTERRYVANDSTVEKIGELLNQNPRGLLLLRDELSGWLRNLDKHGREGDREFYLETWNGTGRYTYDRIGRGTLHVEAITLSILGTIQPAKLRSYVTSAIQSDSGDDGLIQRFQVSVWPDAQGEWKNVDRWPDRDARERAYNIFAALDKLDTASIRATQDDGEIPALRFADKAQALFDAWRDKLETRLRSPELEPTPAFESHLTKYRSLMPSLALIFHLTELVNGGAGGPVSLDAAQLAAAWCDFLEAHARKIYAPELQSEVTAAHALAQKIKAGLIEDGSPVRDIYRPQWSGLAAPEQVMSGLEVLQEHGHLRLEQQETGGRPADVVRLHPKLMKRVT